MIPVKRLCLKPKSGFRLRPSPAVWAQIPDVSCAALLSHYICIQTITFYTLNIEQFYLSIILIKRKPLKTREVRTIVLFHFKSEKVDGQKG